MLYVFTYDFVLSKAVTVMSFGSFTTAVDMYACVAKKLKAFVLNPKGSVMYPSAFLLALLNKLAFPPWLDADGNPMYGKPH